MSAHRSSTLSALRSPNFRLYFAGQLVSVSGTWMQNIAQGYLVFLLTKSELWLGIVACAAGLPMVLLSPIAGVVVERVPRRELMKFTQTAQMILAFILAWLTFAQTVQVWHIVLLAFLLGVTNALDLPARQTFVVEMVGHEDLHSGIALNAILNNLGRILGPTAAGLVLIVFGAGWCFLLNGLSFLAVLISLFIMQVPYAIRYIGKVSPLRQMREGIDYSRRDPAVAPLLLLSAVGGLVIIPIMQLMPAFADVVLHSAEQGFAAMNVGTGVGAVIAGILVGWFCQRLGYGRVIVVAMILTGLSTILLALQVSVESATIMSGLFGGFTILEFVSVNTTLQTVVPDAFRGRVLSLYTLGLLGLAPFGALALGAIANVFGTAPALALFGVLGCIFGGLIVLRWPILLQSDLSAPQAMHIEEILPLPAVGD